MYRRFRKTAAAVMAAVLMLQGAGGAVSAAETQAVTEARAQTETQPATEAQTQPQTETQPATEAQTQPQTETQPATEAQTQPQTETQPATEAQPQTETQPATEAQPQSSETQQQTGAQEQTAASSGQTEAQTADEKADKKKKNKKKEETERSERKNDGAKMSSSDLASGLGNALSYLFAARTVSGPETLLEGQEIADGETGTSIVGSLESFSVKLANARSSSDVEIINVYADENGKLDEMYDFDQVSKILTYCQERGITVMMGDWGGRMVDPVTNRIDTFMLSNAARYADFLVNRKGYDCIKYYNMINEPNGDWSSNQANYDLWVE